MSSIYEGTKDLNGLGVQFTSCCGAYDKGTDDGVVCRSCYSDINEYYKVGNEEAFILTIQDASLVKQFNGLLAVTLAKAREGTST
jgi:hypothetical protein